MSRLNNFDNLMEHPMLSKLFKKLTLTEFEMCQNFLLETDHLNDDEFELKVNRWMIDQEKPKHHIDMWAIVSQCK